jgi:hypothetical protein
MELIVIIPQLNVHSHKQIYERGHFTMEKIRLNDGIELNIEVGASESCIAVVANDLTFIDTYIKALTKENLSHAEVIDENDEVILTIKDKYLSGFDGTQVIESTDFIVCFRLSDVYTIEEKIAMLEAENAKLNETVNTLLGVEE